MGSTIHRSFGTAVWSLASRQHWVVARRQLLALGMSPKAIQHRIATRRLHVIWRGAYAVGHPEPTRCGRLLAAVLASGSGAVLSHTSAAELWGMLKPRDGAIHVSVRGDSARRLGGIRNHRRTTLTDGEVVEHRAIPVTTPLRTLIDLAAKGLSAAELEAAMNEADRLDLVSEEEARETLEVRRGSPGVGRLRKILDRLAFTLTDSALERRFLPISHEAGLPTPQTQVYVSGYRVDFFYPDLGLVVETDGLRYHRTPAQQARDRLRDQAHAAAGLTTLRFTHAQVYYEPAHVRSILAAVRTRSMNRHP